MRRFIDDKWKGRMHRAERAWVIICVSFTAVALVIDLIQHGKLL